AAAGQQIERPKAVRPAHKPPQRVDLLLAWEEGMEVPLVGAAAMQQLQATTRALECYLQAVVEIAREQIGEGTRRIDPVEELGGIALLERQVHAVVERRRQLRAPGRVLRGIRPPLARRC